jgi:hypothetical protein
MRWGGGVRMFIMVVGLFEEARRMILWSSFWCLTNKIVGEWVMS